jgi:hypothetical protein
MPINKTTVIAGKLVGQKINPGSNCQSSSWQESLGLMTISTWWANEAAKESVTLSAIRMRYYRGRYPGLRVVRVSARRVFVHLGNES